MKRKVLALTIAVFFLAVTAVFSGVLWNGQRTSLLSAARTSSAAVVSGPGVLHGIIIVTNGSDNATLSLYDNTSATSGTYTLPTGLVAIGSSSSKTVTWQFSPPAVFSAGIYVSLSVGGGGSATYQIIYDQ